MSNFVTTVDKLLRIPYQIERERDVWKFYCPHCREWHEDYRHGYSSRFSTQMYFSCPRCDMDMEGPGWWVK